MLSPFRPSYNNQRSVELRGILFVKPDEGSRSLPTSNIRPYITSVLENLKTLETKRAK